MSDHPTTWREVPTATIVRLLGFNGVGFHPRDIVKPHDLEDRYKVPSRLLPVRELVLNACPTGTVLLGDNGSPVFAMQGVVIGDLIDAIAEGLGVRLPADAPAGYAASRFALAKAIVMHVNRRGERDQEGGDA